nr:hypothetical protein [Tanacetum cinerariifolium]
VQNIMVGMCQLIVSDNNKDVALSDALRLDAKGCLMECIKELLVWCISMSYSFNKNLDCVAAKQLVDFNDKIKSADTHISIFYPETIECARGMPSKDEYQLSYSWRNQAKNECIQDFRKN